jgi:hypothetical protein
MEWYSMFSCFNPDKTPAGKCEWKGGNLEDFVRQFNLTRATSYVLEECLDTPKPGVTLPNLKQPEVLLKGRPHEPKMVIERKQVIAQSYAAHHGNLHVLYDMIPEALMPHFGGALYSLELNESSIEGKKKREVQEATREITKQVIANRERVLTSGTVGSSQPFPWRFGRVPEYARPDNAPEIGIGVNFYGSDFWSLDTQDSLRQVEEAYAGTREILERVLRDVELKFAAYLDHLKVVVLEFYGDRDLLTDDDAKRMVREVVLPASIDEVWIAHEVWVSEWDFEIGYERVR